MTGAWQYSCQRRGSTYSSNDVAGHRRRMASITTRAPRSSATAILASIVMLWSP